jgi:hypothetical protein
MILNINTWQRIQLELLIGEVKGPAATVRKAVKLLDVLEMSKDEKEAVGLRQVQGGMVWDEPDHLFSIEIKDGNLEVFLRELVKQKEDWPANRHALDLIDQLGVDD